MALGHYRFAIVGLLVGAFVIVITPDGTGMGWRLLADALLIGAIAIGSGKD